MDEVTRLDALITSVPKPGYWRAIFDRFVRQETDGYFLVAARGEEFLGFIVGEIREWEFGSQPCGWVFAIAVNPELRLGSVGTALFETLCDRFRKAGVTKIRTMLARDAQLVMSFFRSQGMMAGPFIQLEKDLDE
ncbi:MAG: GNAT family N-acetyltransferase [Solirubrobacterales bacterium]